MDQIEYTDAMLTGWAAGQDGVAVVVGHSYSFSNAPPTPLYRVRVSPEIVAEWVTAYIHLLCEIDEEAAQAWLIEFGEILLSRVEEREERIKAIMEEVRRLLEDKDIDRP